jgi:predicted transcriptional regulator
MQYDAEENTIPIFSLENRKIGFTVEVHEIAQMITAGVDVQKNSMLEMRKIDRSYAVRIMDDSGEVLPSVKIFQSRDQAIAYAEKIQDYKKEAEEEAKKVEEVKAKALAKFQYEAKREEEAKAKKEEEAKALAKMLAKMLDDTK